VLLDNARALVERHDGATREVVFNARLHAFARYWGFRPRACSSLRGQNSLRLMVHSSQSLVTATVYSPSIMSLPAAM